MTPEQITQLRGSLVVKNISGGVLNLTTYDGISLAIDEELDLLDMGTPMAIMAGEYTIAKDMVTRAQFELAQLITAGDLEIVADVLPDVDLMEQFVFGEVG